MTTGDPKVTLGDLMRAGIELVCRCRACGHASEVPAGLVAARLGPGTAVGDVAGAGVLYCRACGRKQIAVRAAWGP